MKLSHKNMINPTAIHVDRVMNKSPAGVAALKGVVEGEIPKEL